MESLSQLQNIVMEHAFTIGMGLLVAVLVAGIAWFWMSRSSVKSSILVNNAHMNEADMNVELNPSVPDSDVSAQVNQDQVEQAGVEHGQVDSQVHSDQ
jgi:hypothetical protein